jgi:hypothetical protein
MAGIRIVVFTISGQPGDIAASYSRHASAYVTRPLGLDDFTAAVGLIHDFHGDLAARPSTAG